MLDATACPYKLGAEKACHRWSFMFKCDGAVASLSEFKNYLVINHGVKEVKDRNFPKATKTGY